MIRFEGWEFEEGKEVDVGMGDDVREGLIREKEGRMMFEGLV